MNFQEVQERLADLPSTYTRPGPNYQRLDLSRAAELFRYTNGADGVIEQLNFSQAVGPWLDVWGKLFVIPRNTNESDDSYHTRILFTLLAGRVTPNAILLYLLNTIGAAPNLVENFPQCEFRLVFTQPLTTAAFEAVAQNLASVRPAGVPFLPFEVLQGGSYLGTVNFTGAAKVTGAYLDAPVKDFTPALDASTNNAVPLLPTTFLTDPSINPVGT